MSDLVLPPGFFTRPPPMVVRLAALERVVQKYEEQLAQQVKILASLALHASDLARGKKVKLVPGGFAVPFSWQADIPSVCDLNVEDDRESGQMTIRVLGPSPRLQGPDLTGWHVPDEQKRAEDEELA
jgi:hypothetical protein